MQLQFLGFGNAGSELFGNSAAVLEVGSDSKTLVIDFGFTVLPAFKKRYGRLPDAVFLTHGHLDHIGGLEALFYDAYLKSSDPIKLFVPHKLVGLLHQRMGSLESILAEGGANFWDAFQLIPVSDSFWFEQVKFVCFEVRHHSPGFGFGLAVPGCFLYSGDTKPIPEIINHFASHNEVIFHDIALTDQPSHTYVDELNAYKASQLERMWFYHVNNPDCVTALRARGLNVVDDRRVFRFACDVRSDPNLVSLTGPPNKAVS